MYFDSQEFQLSCNTNQEPRYIEISTDMFFDLLKLMNDLKTCLIFKKEPWT